MGWIGLGAQAWIEFFCEKAFGKRGVQFSLTQGRRRNWLSFVLRNHPSMSLEACEHPSRFRFPAHPKFLKK